ncbi:protein containing UspA domain protein, partial [gut metagenome]
MRILLPVDGSVYSKTAIHFVASRQAVFGSGMNVELLNVQHLVPKALIDLLSLTAVNAYSEAEAQKVFDALDDTIKASGLVAKTQALTGNIGDTIVEEANKTHTDLVVMGTHGRSGLSSLLLGSVSIRVLSKIGCPLLLVRENSPVIQNHLRVGLCVDDPAHAIAGARLIAEHIGFFGKTPEI